MSFIKEESILLIHWWQQFTVYIGESHVVNTVVRCDIPSADTMCSLEHEQCTYCAFRQIEAQLSML